MASNTVRVLNTVSPKTGLTVVRELTDWNKKKKKKTVLTWETWRGDGGEGGGDLIITWAEKVGKRGRTKSSCPRNNFPCDKTYFKEGNYFDGYGRCKGIYFDDHSLLSTFSSMTSLDVYFDAHATQLELSFRSDVWRAFTYLHVWDKAFLDKKRVFV